jgi:hypothetical protein
MGTVKVTYDSIYVAGLLASSIMHRATEIPRLGHGIRYTVGLDD